MDLLFHGGRIRGRYCPPPHRGLAILERGIVSKTLINHPVVLRPRPELHDARENRAARVVPRADLRSVRVPGLAIFKPPKHRPWARLS